MDSEGNSRTIVLEFEKKKSNPNRVEMKAL